MNTKQIKQVVSTKLYDWRTSQNIPQEQIADCMGKSVRAVQSWEAGDKLPRIDALITIADLMCISLDSLLNHEVVKPDSDV